MYVIFLVHETDSLGVENILFLSFFLATRKRCHKKEKHTFIFSIYALQENVESTTTKITYEGPFVSYLIYEGRNPAVVS
jgi:hypothetical protein